MVVDGYRKQALAKRRRPRVNGHRFARHLYPVCLHFCQLDRPLQTHHACGLSEGRYDRPRARAVTTSASAPTTPTPSNPALAAIGAHRLTT